MICDVHAKSGARVTLLYEATETKRVEVRTHGITEGTVKRMAIRDQ